MKFLCSSRVSIFLVVLLNIYIVYGFHEDCALKKHKLNIKMGDAAHAMVPFYGQGMNCGFEDCTLLDQLLTEFDGNFKNVLENFTERRMHDAHAICDLAMYNFEEMKNLVTTKTYQLRKLLDNVLFQLFPQYWIPLYNSVSFSEIRYTQCMKNRQWQNWVLLITFGGIFLCGLLLFFFTWMKS